MNDTMTFPVSKSGLRLLWISALVIVADQISKWWIATHLSLTTPYVRGEEVVVLPVLNIIHTTNTGAAWSIGADSGMSRWIFAALAIAVSIALVVWLRRLMLATHTLLVSGLTLILGGAIGNVIDRLRLGEVVDFVQVHWGNSYFPSFNVADSAISIGAGLVIIDSLLQAQRERRQRATAEEGK